MIAPTLPEDKTDSTSAQIEEAFFDNYVRKLGDFNPFLDRGWRTIRRRFEQWSPFSGNVDLLDVGCGTGNSLQIYAAHARNYTGLDLSAEAIRHAQVRFPDATWMCGDACELPFEDSSFDIVAFSSVLHHIPDFTRALREAARVLRPGGWVFAFDPNLLHPAMCLFRYPKSPFYKPEGVSPNESPLLPRTLRNAFKEAGFGHLRQRAQSNIPYRAVAPGNVNRWLKVYNALDWCWEHVGLGRHFGAFVLTAGSLP